MTISPEILAEIANSYSEAIAAGPDSVLTSEGYRAGNSTVYTVANLEGIEIANASVTFTLEKPTAVQVANGQYYLAADSQWKLVSAGQAAGGTNTQVQFNDSNTFAGDANLTFDKTTTKLTVGNSTVNVFANSMAVKLANSTVNTQIIVPTSAQYAGAYYLKADGSWSTVTAGSALPAGANTHVQYNDSGVTGGIAGFTFNEAANNVFIANTLTVGSATVNSTNYSQTANNALNLGGVLAADYQTEAGLVANVATMTANNALYLGGVLAADYQTETGLVANVATMTANNALYLGGTVAAGYQTTAWLAANVITLTANDANFLGGVAAASYALDADLDAYQTEAGLAANVVTLTANDAAYLGGLAAANYANLSVATFTTSVNVGANVQLSTSRLHIGNTTVNLVANSTALKLANSTSNTTVTVPTAADWAGNKFLHANGTWATPSAAAAAGGSNTYVQYNDSTVLGGAAGFTFDETTNNVTIANTLTIGTATINSTNYTQTANNALYLGGVLAADYQTEAGLAGNVATLASNSTTYIPVTNGIVSNSTGVWITANSGLLTNTTGLHVGTGNGISVTTDAVAILGGSTLTVNTTGAHVNSTLLLPTSLSVGANVVANTTTILVGNSIVNTVVGNTQIAIGNSTVNAVANSIAFKLANSTVAWTLIKPTAAEVTAANYYPASDGVWKQVTGGAGTPSGADTEIQYNASGSFGANQYFTFDAVTTKLTVGNSTVNVIANSSVVKLANSTVNTQILVPSAAQYAGQYYLKADGSWSTVSAGSAAPAGANTHVQYNDSGVTGGTAGFTYDEATNNVFVANTLTVGSATINSTNYNQTANNALNLGGVAAADYQTEAGLAANVATLDANNAAYLGGVAAADYQTEAGLAANVATLASNSTTYIPVTNGVVSNSLGVWITAGVGLLTNTTGLHAGSGNGITTSADAIQVTGGSTLTVNVTGAHVNSTLLLPTSLAVGANVLVDTVTAFIGNTTANLSANSIAIKIANSTANTIIDPVNMFQGNSIANSNSNSISFKLANATANLILTPVNVFAGNSVANLNANSILVSLANATSIANLSPLALTIGSRVVNSTAVDAGILTAGNTTVTGFVNASVSVNSALVTVGVVVTANSTLVNAPAINITGQVNTATFNSTGAAAVGTTLSTGNTTVTGFVNATISVNSALFTTTGVTANVTGVYPTSNTSGQNLGITTARWVMFANTLDISSTLTANGGLGSAAQVLTSNSTGGAYWAAAAGGGSAATRVYQVFTATGGQTAFVLTNTFANSFVDVYYNGVHLANTEFTANSASNTVTLGVAANLNAVVEVSCYSNATISEFVAIPGGADTQVQFKDGAVINGTAGFTFDKATNNAVIANTLTAGIKVVAPNTGLITATSAASNGYTYLTGGILMQWGWVSATTTVGNATFPIAFPANIWGWNATGNTAGAATYAAIVIAANTTVLQCRTGNVTASNVHWMAIGS